MATGSAPKMRHLIAIQPDDYTDRQTLEKCDASSPRWAASLEESGHLVRWVNVYRPDIVEQVRGCDGFMWRWGHTNGMYRIARRILPVFEHYLGLAVYPDQNTCWHYDDKISQAYLLPAVGIPTPKTWVFWNMAEAIAFCSEARYPLVFKMAGGAGSSNVCLLESAEEAKRLVGASVSATLHRLAKAPYSHERRPLGRSRVLGAIRLFLTGRPPVGVPRYEDHCELPGGYAILQEFLPNNSFDTRVTVIGNRAFAFRRFNRPGDFRASGSGRIDHNPQAIDERMIRLAFSVAQKLGTQSIAIDGLYREGECVVGEISYTYASWAVHDCPGHWQLDGDAGTGSVQWVPGQIWPEEAQVADFLLQLDDRCR